MLPALLAALAAFARLAPAQTQVPRAVPVRPAAAVDLAPLAEARKLARGERATVELDWPGDGRLWARGATYKASFGAEGATYVPFLGARAPRNYPVRFALKSAEVGGHPLGFDAAAAPVLSGTTVSYDRGSLVEIYELEPGSVEQKFVLASAPSGGDLVLRIEVATELARGESAAGLELSNEHGGMRYGRAAAIDASRRSVPAVTAFSEGAIEIRVDGEFLAGASFPLVIDPVFVTFTVDNSGEDDFLPDVAYDAATDRYLVVYEETYSGTDHDIQSALLGPTGAVLNLVYVDFTAAHWQNPSVADLAATDQFLVVGQVGAPGGRDIFARTRDAASTSQGTAFMISSSTADEIEPDVGGDPFPFLPSSWYVVWEEIVSASDHDILGRTVDADLSFDDTISVDFSGNTIDQRPSISKSNGSYVWNIVWQSAVTPSNRNIHAARVGWDGNQVGPTVGVENSFDDTTRPRASSSLPDNLTWMVVYEQLFPFPPPGDHDLVGVLLNGTAVIDSADLTLLENASTLYQDQVDPAVDSDGVGFAVAYAELALSTSTDFDVYAASFTPVDGRIHASEGHRFLTASPAVERHPDIVSVFGAGSGSAARCAIAWDAPQGASQNGSIFGALYDVEDFTSFCLPLEDDVIGCPCGNPPAQYGRGCNNSSNTGGAILTQVGTASIANDTVRFDASGERPTAASIFLQGNAHTNVAFGQGVRCVGGTLKRLYAKTASGGSVSAPVGSDPRVWARSAALGDLIAAGSTRYYLVYYRDPTVLGGCPSASTFNATQSGAITWRP